MRQLYLLRHAKSAWDTQATSDFQRPLNKRGVRNASEVGQWMADRDICPEQVISSPALRAWQTATLVCREIGITENDIQFNADLYLAGRDTLLKILSGIVAGTQSVMLIGHNPGMEELLNYLSADSVPSNGNGKVFPTATLARLDIAAQWPELTAGAAQLDFVEYPVK